MNKRLLLFAFVAVLALVTLSCGAPMRSAPIDDAMVEDGAMRGDPKAAGVRVSCIDVGKGDCILVQEGTAAALIDTGHKETTDEVLAYLEQQGVVRLDALVLTHYDKDHVGGLRSIAGAVRVDRVYLPAYVGADRNYKMTVATVDDLDLEVQLVEEELALELDEAQMTVYPSRVAYVRGSNGDEGNDNDASLVLALRCGHDSYLFAGDLEEEGIDAYLSAEDGCFDVLKMPHHGEKSANTDSLIDAVQPKVALITDGEGDPADKKVLKLLTKAGVDTYRTSADGTIVVESDGSGSYVVSAEGDE